MLALLVACGDDDPEIVPPKQAQTCTEPPPEYDLEYSASDANGKLAHDVPGMLFGYKIVAGDLVDTEGTELAASAPNPFGQNGMGELGQVVVASLSYETQQSSDAFAFVEGGEPFHGFGVHVALVPGGPGGGARLAIGDPWKPVEADGEIWFFDTPWRAASPPGLDDASAYLLGRPFSRAAVVEGGGDLDDDGRLDMVVGANCLGCAIPGRLAIFPADATGNLALDDAPITIWGSESREGLGSIVPKGAIDVDSDGQADVAAYEERPAPLLSLLRGPFLTDASVADAVTEVSVGITGLYPLVSADINADGHDDLAMGSHIEPGSLSDRDGAAWVLHGPVPEGSLGLDDMGTTVVASTPNQGIGSAIEVLPDVDGDGYDELVVGAWNDYYLGWGPGQVLVFAGPAVGTLEAADATWAVAGECAYDSFGWSVAVADADGDAVSDLLVGAVGHDSGAGAVYLFSGADLFR